MTDTTCLLCFADGSCNGACDGKTVNANLDRFPGGTVTQRQRAARGLHPMGFGMPGPDGETCKSCDHYYTVQFAKRYLKCGLVKATAGPGTDVRARWLACDRWLKVPE